MEIKVAKNVNESKTLAAAQGSDRWAIALLAGAALATGVWFFVPEKIKTNMAPALGAAGMGAAMAIRLGLVQVKNGRLSVGDLDAAVANVALLPTGQGAVLEMLKPVVEGTIPLGDLPAVRALINEAVKNERGDRMIDAIKAQGIAPDPADFDLVNIPSMPKPRILDPNWKAPV